MDEVCGECGRSKETGPDENGLRTFHGHVPDWSATRVHALGPGVDRYTAEMVTEPNGERIMRITPAD